MEDVDQMEGIQLVAVCGSNKRLKSRLTAMEYKMRCMSWAVD